MVHSAGPGTVLLKVCAGDRPGLLWDMLGVFLKWPVDLVKADLSTSAGLHVLDVFWLKFYPGVEVSPDKLASAMQEMMDVATPLYSQTHEPCSFKKH